MDTLIVGIAGGSGSGKTTLTHYLQDYFQDDVTVIYHDNYYRAHDELPFEERCKLNYDHPDSFETELLVEHLKQLKAGKSIECPIYDYTIHNRTAETFTVKPNSVIVLDGILLFENEALRNMMDIKIFVDTDADVRILRRIKRDFKERGRSLDSVINQYLATVKPMHERFVEPSKRYADIVILEGGYNVVAQDFIIHKIQNHIDKNK